MCLGRSADKVRHRCRLLGQQRRRSKQSGDRLRLGHRDRQRPLHPCLERCADHQCLHVGSAGIAAGALLVFAWLSRNPALLSIASANYLADSFSGLSGLFHLSPVNSLYFPSPNEWLTSLGVIGLTVILFAIGWQVLPLETESH